MELRWYIKKALRRFGYDIVPFDPLNYPDIKRRKQLLETFTIDTILDVGANQGQYAILMRKLGFSGKIISFEPLSTAYKMLQEKAQNDPLWQTVNIALGDEDGVATINIAAKEQASSIREMEPSLQESAMGMEYVDKEQIKIRTLDSVLYEYTDPDDKIYLKIDTQGYEENVLRGAQNSLKHIAGLQLELSLIELYKGEKTLGTMLPYIQDLGYTLMSLEPGYTDKRTGQLLQVDAIFFREKE